MGDFPVSTLNFHQPPSDATEGPPIWSVSLALNTLSLRVMLNDEWSWSSSNPERRWKRDKPKREKGGSKLGPKLGVSDQEDKSKHTRVCCDWGWGGAIAENGFLSHYLRRPVHGWVSCIPMPNITTHDSGPNLSPGSQHGLCTIHSNADSFLWNSLLAREFLHGLEAGGLGSLWVVPLLTAFVILSK